MQNEEFIRVLLEMTDTLYRVAATQLHQPADREDAVQETLRRAWEKRRTLREERYLQTWVIRILLNVCHNIQRVMKRIQPTDSLPSAAPREDTSALKEALLQLEERYRMPILLYYLEGYTVAEVAQILRIPQGTVKTRLSRGRKALKAFLNEEVFEG